MSDSTKTNDRKRQQGFVMVLLCLCLTLLVGVVGFVLDLGNRMLTRQRIQTATDLAAIAGTQLRANSYGSDYAQDYAQYTVTANRIASSASLEWSDVMPDAAAVQNDSAFNDGLVVSYNHIAPTYFAHVLSGGAHLPQSISSAAQVRASKRSTSTHLILVIDDSMFARREFTSPDRYFSRFNPTPSGVVGATLKADVIYDIVDGLLSQLTLADRISIVPYSRYTELLFQQEVPTQETLKKVRKELAAITQETGILADISGSEMHLSDPATGIYGAMQVLANNEERLEETDLTNVVLLTTGENWWRDFRYRSQSPPAPYQGKISAYSYVEEFPNIDFELEGTRCKTFFPGCERLYGGSATLSFNRRQIDATYISSNNVPLGSNAELRECLDNPTFSAERVSAYLVSKLQARYDARFIPIRVGRPQDRIINQVGSDYYTVDEDSRTANYLARLAQDPSREIISPELTIDCAGERSDRLSGKYFEVSSPRESYEGLLKEVMNEARRPYGNITDGESMEAHLIQN